MSDNELEASAGDKKLKIKGEQWLPMFGAAVGVLLVYIVLEHKGEAKASGEQFQAVIKEMVVAQRDMVSAQREQNCLIAFTQEMREKNAEFCKRIARDR